MKLQLALYFYILAIIQLGLLLGIYHYYRSQSTIRPSPYWMGSLITSILALVIFGSGILIIQDVSKPEFNFTIANTLFYIAAILQLFFCRSLSKPIGRRMQYAFACSVIVFLPSFEWMRVNGTFESRTAVMCILIGTFYIWQIVQLREKRKSTPSLQLKYLQYATTAELFFALGRLVVVIASGFTIRQVEQIPQFLILLTITQLVMNTLAYIAIGGYWSERIASANAQSQNENLEIKALLNERESLISSLLKANKTAATGALSASIAHELNQPLGATQLNIQFLQKKLTDGNLSAEQNQEVLAALLNDNQRAANIIQSLRSIFSDGKIGVEKVDLNDLLQSVLKIAKSEIQAQSIRVVLNLQSTTLVTANRGEIQQVILNLINNAIQALSDSPRANRTISIESHDVPNGVKVIVTDDGEGISLDAQSHLFELLSSSEKRSGMGLGLWLCQHIISRHGGQIEYQDAPNGGAQFTVYLPTSQE